LTLKKISPWTRMRRATDASGSFCFGRTMLTSKVAVSRAGRFRIPRVDVYGNSGYVPSSLGYVNAERTPHAPLETVQKRTAEYDVSKEILCHD
jgi:hypothetical protein